jgi:hypothetical protein
VTTLASLRPSGMLVPMRFGASISFWVGLVLASCGGNTESTPPRPDAGRSGGTGGQPTEVDAGGAAGLEAGAGGELPFDAGSFTDPGCPDSSVPAPYFECDPFVSPSGCDAALGLGCFPFLIYPSDDSGCGHAQYGAVCAYAGDGTQGELCGDDNGGCAEGYMCVVGAKPGKRCTKICPLDGRPHNCPAGLVCGETDVQGIGVCV